MTFSGTIERKYSATPGRLAGTLAPRLARKAVAALAGTGTSRNSNVGTLSATPAPNASTARNHPRLRRAMPPALAVRTVWNTPVKISAATKGTIVPCNARSHRSPVGPATASTAGSEPGDKNASTSPPPRPTVSAANVHPAGICAIGGSTSPPLELSGTLP